MNKLISSDLVASRAEKQQPLLQPRRPIGAPATSHLAYKPDHISDPELRRHAQANTIANPPQLRTIQEAFERRYKAGEMKGGK